MQDPADRTEQKFRDLKALNTTQIEAALCAWEWMCENRDGDQLGELFQNHGTVAMRWVSMQAGHIVCLVHDHMLAQGYEFADAYDWEFVPSVLQKLDWGILVDDNQDGGEPYKPNIHAIFCAMVAADKASQAEPKYRSFQKPEPAPDIQAFTPDQYIAACRAEAEAQWGYGDLVSDHREKVTNAMEAAEDPATFIQWLGEKYDLTPKENTL